MSESLISDACLDPDYERTNLEECIEVVRFRQEREVATKAEAEREAREDAERAAQDRIYKERIEREGYRTQDNLKFARYMLSNSFVSTGMLEKLRRGLRNDPETGRYVVDFEALNRAIIALSTPIVIDTRQTVMRKQSTAALEA